MIKKQTTKENANTKVDYVASDQRCLMVFEVVEYINLIKIHVG